jgi:hypothetical protein
VSFVFVASNRPRIIDLFSRVLRYMANILSSYPGAPIEIVVVFCPANTTAFGNFFGIFDVPRAIRQLVRVIEVPPTDVERRKRRHNITYFPEFELKNIGVRRANGEFIISANGDCIPPLGFFEAAAKRSLSPLSYIRSKRIYANVSRVSDMLAFWLAMQKPKWQHQGFVNVCRDRRYYDKYERDGCGDFQGAHKQMWEAIHGFLESEHVFHVDTGLSLEFSAFPSFIYARVLGTNVHLRHPKESKVTSHFRFYDDTIKNCIRQGVMTHMTDRYARPDWGGQGIEYKTY